MHADFGFGHHPSDKEISVLRGEVGVPYISREWAAKACWAMRRITSGTPATARSKTSGSASYMIVPNARGTDSGSAVAPTAPPFCDDLSGLGCGDMTLHQRYQVFFLSAQVRV